MVTLLDEKARGRPCAGSSGSRLPVGLLDWAILVRRLPPGRGVHRGDARVAGASVTIRGGARSSAPARRCRWTSPSTTPTTHQHPRRARPVKITAKAPRTRTTSTPAPWRTSRSGRCRDGPSRMPAERDHRPARPGRAEPRLAAADDAQPAGQPGRLQGRQPQARLRGHGAVAHEPMRRARARGRPHPRRSSPPAAGGRGRPSRTGGRRRGRRPRPPAPPSPSP